MDTLEKALKAAEDACAKAASIIMEGYENLNLETGSKTDAADVYTPVDEEAQKVIEASLRSAFPEYAFLGEEGEQTSVSMEGYCWAVDPIDGTSNFSHKIPHFGTSVALLKDGIPVVGVLHFPVSEETYTAIADKGAWKNGQSIHIQDKNALSDSVLAEMFSDRIHRGKPVPYPPGIAYRRFGSAITSLAFLAEGRVHASLLRCHLWDIAAADLIIREAGGKTAMQFDNPSDFRSLLIFTASVPGIFDSFTDLAEKTYIPSLKKGAL